MELKRVGTRKLSQFKRDFLDFKNYLEVNYDYKIVKKEGQNAQPDKKLLKNLVDDWLLLGCPAQKNRSQ